MPPTTQMGIVKRVIEQKNNKGAITNGVKKSIRYI